MARVRKKSRIAPPSIKNTEKLSGIHLFLWFLTFAYLGLVVFGFTQYTHNLDEIKVTFLYVGGPILLLVYLFFAATGYVRIFPKFPALLLVGYMLVLFISTLFAGEHYSWIGWIQLCFRLSCLGGFLICYGLMRSKTDVRRAIFIFMVFGLGTTIFGLFHYAGGFQLIENLFYQSESSKTSQLYMLIHTFAFARDDMFSTILNRQFYAAFLVMLIPLSTAYSIVEDKKHFWKYAAIAASIFMVICLYLAHSKASSGALVLTALAFIILYRLFAKYKKIKIPHLGIWIIGFVILALTLGFFTADVGPEKFKTIHRSVESRTIIWKGGWDQFLYGAGPENWYEIDDLPLNFRSILIGPGPGTFRLIFPRYRSPDYHLHDISNVTLFSHNRYLDLLAENGLLGFLLYMAFFGLFFYMAMKYLLKSRDGEMRVFLIAFICSIFGIMLSNIFSPNNRWAVVATNMWAILGLGFGAIYTAKDRIAAAEAKDKDESPPPSRTLAMPSPAVSTSLIVAVVFLLPVAFLCVKFGMQRFTGAAKHNTGLTMVKQSEIYTEEIEKMERAVQQNPQMASRLNEQIQKYKGVRDRLVMSAIEYYHRALEDNPYFITTYYKLAHAYNTIHDIENSLKTYERLQKYAPDYSEVHFNLGVVSSSLAQLRREQASRASGEEKTRLLNESEKFEEKALNEFQIAAEMSNKPAVQEMYGRKLIMMRNFEEAREVFRYLIELQPGNRLHIRTMAWLCDQLDDKESALKYFKEIFKSDPTNEYYARRVEELLQELERQDEYRDFLIEFVEINPLDPAPRMRLIELYVREDDMKGLEDQLKALSRLPDLIVNIGRTPSEQQERLWGLALAAQKTGDLSLEKIFLEKTLNIDRSTSIGISAQKRLKQLQ